MRVFCSLFIWFFGLFLVTRQAYAQVVINEVFPAPSTGTEWVELYNASDVAVSLAQWRLEDHLTSPSVIHQFAENATISPHNYLVVEVSNKLNNSGDGVTLKNAIDAIGDTMTYSSSVTDMSWARRPNATGTFVSASPSRAVINFEEILPSPSSTASPLSTPSPTPSFTPILTPGPSPSPAPIYPSNLQASEVFSCPESGETEWLEVYNPDPQPYTLSNWRVKDRTGNSRIVNATVPASGWGVLTWGGSLLNNDGDAVALERPDGLRLFALEFPACHQQKSFILHDGIWQETEVITQGVTNTWQGPLETELANSLTASPEPVFSSPSLFSETSQSSASLSPSINASDKSTTSLTSSTEVIPWETLHFPAPPALVSSDSSFNHPSVLSAQTADPLPQKSNFALASLWSGAGCALLSSSYTVFRWYTELHAKNSFAPQ